MAEIVIVVFTFTPAVVIENAGDTVAPAATVTEAGTAARAGLLLERTTVSPPEGATPTSETVLAVVVEPPPIDLGDNVSRLNTGWGKSVRTALAELKLAVAVMVNDADAVCVGVTMENVPDVDAA
jgi:hypothetical protein